MRIVTCVHGFSQHGDSWGELRSLVPGEHRWLTPDVGAATLAGAEDELLALWEREGVERTDLVGYSQGGRIALFVAARHPHRVRTLTTIGAHAGFEHGRSARLAADLTLAARIEREGIDWFATYWAGLPLFAGLARRGPALLERLDASRRRNDPARLAAQLRGMGAGAIQPFWDRLSRIDAPAMVVAGAEDERYVAFAGRLAEALPRARVAIVPKAGHAAHLEQPAAVAVLLADHLAVTAAAPGSRAAPTRPPAQPSS
jgi:2-succinyl-6-hydroxy-2,4-cyclohexadiene-1-carboxylate synthase